MAGLSYHPFEEEEIAFLKESEVFGALSDDTLRMIRGNGRVEDYEPDTTVFAIGDPVGEVYIVKSGIAEICRPTDDPDRLTVVAFLTAGDSIGEMSIFISGDTRNSICRVPEGAEVLVLTFEMFMRLFKALPELAVRLTSVFARRLRTSIKKQRIQRRHRTLNGSLAHFDLPSVFRTLLSTDERTGLMTVYAPETGGEAEKLAEAYLEAGRVRFARMGHLVGEEAFYQIMQSDLTGASFEFREGKFPEGFDQNSEITTQGMSLLLEATRLAGELDTLKERIPDPEKVYTPTQGALKWDDASTRTLANSIWSMLRRKVTVNEILESLPRSHYSIYSMLSAMLTQGLIE